MDLPHRVDFPESGPPILLATPQPRAGGDAVAFAARREPRAGAIWSRRRGGSRGASSARGPRSPPAPGLAPAARTGCGRSRLPLLTRTFSGGPPGSRTQHLGIKSPKPGVQPVQLDCRLCWSEGVSGRRVPSRLTRWSAVRETFRETRAMICCPMGAITRSAVCSGMNIFPRSPSAGRSPRSGCHRSSEPSITPLHTSMSVCSPTRRCLGRLANLPSVIRQAGLHVSRPFSHEATR